MVDSQTVQVYDGRAGEFAARYRALRPEGLYRLVRGFFHPAQATADVGCGSGRDAAWLAGEGFTVIGYDASPSMLAAARAAYPGLTFRHDSLPELATVPDNAFANVLCSAVLMHLPREALIGAVLNLARILRPNGRMVLAYRASLGDDEREADGRLFTSIPADQIISLLESAGFRVLNAEEQPDSSRREVTWNVVAAEQHEPLVRGSGGPTTGGWPAPRQVDFLRDECGGRRSSDSQ